MIHRNLQKCLILICFLLMVAAPTHARLCKHVLTPWEETKAQLSLPFTKQENVIRGLLYRRDSRKIFRERPFDTRVLIQLALKLQYRFKRGQSLNSQLDDARILLETAMMNRWSPVDREWLVDSYPHFDLLQLALHKKPPEDLILDPDNRIYSHDYTVFNRLWDLALDYFYFGIDHPAIEDHEWNPEVSASPKDYSKWWGLSPNALNTPYTVIQTIFRHPLVADASKVIDMGSGAGRFILYAGIAKPEVEIVGYEYFAHRMRYAAEAISSLHFTNARLYQTDFVDPKTIIEPADVYITYYSNSDPKVLTEMFKKIRQANVGRSYRVVALRVPNMTTLAPHLQLMDSNPVFSVYESK